MYVEKILICIHRALLPMYNLTYTKQTSLWTRVLRYFRESKYWSQGKIFIFFGIVYFYATGVMYTGVKCELLQRVSHSKNVEIPCTIVFYNS